MPFVWIVIASAIAHLWCLGSQFYMDDIPQLRDDPSIPAGEILHAKLNAWTQLWYVIQYRLFGMSEMGFHVLNWLLHTAVACALYIFAWEFVRGKYAQGVALFAAVLFAVHPLGSEIPNYVRTQDLAWVTLFSMLAAWAALLFVRQTSWELVPGEEVGQIPIFQRSNRLWKILFCLLAVLGATFSKGPGLFHAVMAVVVVSVAFAPRGWGNQLRQKWWWPVSAVVLLAGAGWIGGLAEPAMTMFRKLEDPRFIGHGYTVTRVFWEFVWRCFVPVGLSSDHHIAETMIGPVGSYWNIPDKVAMLSAFGMLAFAALSIYLTWRPQTRWVGVCFLLFSGTMLVRLLYLIPEFMPEYRIYPGLPWFCLGIAMVLSTLWKKFLPDVSPKGAAIVLMAVFAGLSAKRSFLWHDIDRLTADVLKCYPTQGRAIWEQHDQDAAEGNWSAIIERQQKAWPEVVKHYVEANAKLAPARELPSGHFVLAEVACMGRYAEAIAHVHGMPAGLRAISALENRLKQLGLQPARYPIYWDAAKRSKALVLEAGGRYQEARDLLHRKEMNREWLNDYQRISRKADQP